MTSYKYNCISCNYNTNHKSNYNKHLLSKKHIENNQKVTNKYICDLCNYETNKKFNYDTHLISKKHKLIFCEEIDDNEIYKCECSKTYKHKNNLSRHKKKCDYNEDKKVIIQLQEQQQKIQEQLKQLKEEQNKIKNNNNCIIGNNNNNVVNNFNINNYLNNECSNAKNLKQFIDELEIKVTEILDIPDIGYERTLIKLLINGLNNLSQTDRPIQTTDKKRKKYYIKNKENEWIKEEKNFKFMNNMIKTAANKIVNMICLMSKTSHKCFLDTTNEKMNEKYNKILIQILNVTTSDNENKDFNKIQNQLLENTEIDKAS
jgi:hypothetical protein